MSWLVIELRGTRMASFFRVTSFPCSGIQLAGGSSIRPSGESSTGDVTSSGTATATTPALFFTEVFMGPRLLHVERDPFWDNAQGRCCGLLLRIEDVGGIASGTVSLRRGVSPARAASARHRSQLCSRVCPISPQTSPQALHRLRRGIVQHIVVWRLRPVGDQFAEPLRSRRPSIA